MTAASGSGQTLDVVVMSHRPEVREAVMSAVGRRPARDVPRLTFTEADGISDVLGAADSGRLDLAVLDAEAQPTGGMGVCRQLKNERTDPAPVIVVVRREDDRWLATWSQADAVLVQPLDPVTAARTVADVLRAGQPVPASRGVTAGMSAAGVAPEPAAAVAPTWPALLGRLLRGEDLAGPEAAWAMDRMMSGEASPAQVAAFAVALRAKGETAEEIGGLAEVMRAHAREVTVDGVVVDIVGTGGDQAHTVNISTMAAVVMAAAGARVVKHGGRAASSACGSVDLLEELGVPVDLGPEAVAASVDAVGIGFCFAQTFHPAMRHVGGVRREIGVPTAFNLLGPLTNPARPAAALIGCADARFAPVLASVLAGRGDTALVVRGDDGLDEITTTTTTTVWRARPSGVTVETLDPTVIGVPVSAPGELRGGDAGVNARVARSVFAGEAGPVREAVLLNAGAALAAHEEAETGKSDELHDAVARGRDRAAAAVDAGAAASLLERWIEAATRLRG